MIQTLEIQHKQRHTQYIGEELQFLMESCCFTSNETAVFRAGIILEKIMGGGGGGGKVGVSKI